jgi:hypothetical protein
MRYFDEVELSEFDDQLKDVYERLFVLDERIEKIEMLLKKYLFENLVLQVDKKIDFFTVLQKELHR